MPVSPKRPVLDNDANTIALTPPVLNAWNTVFNAQNVRLLWCRIYQTNNEAAAKNIEVRWTIDGHVYFVVVALASATASFIYKDYSDSAGGALGLTASAAAVNAALGTAKCGAAFRVEVRITSALGTAQGLYCWCIRETLGSF